MTSFWTKLGSGFPFVLLLVAVIGLTAVTGVQAQSTLPAPHQTSFEPSNQSGPWDGWTPTRVGSGPYWNQDYNTTGSSSTGPSGPKDGSYYVYLETSTSSGEAYLTNRFNLTALNNPSIYFWYHMYGSTMGSLYFQVSTNGGGSWATLWSRTGQQHSGYTAPWSQATVSLSSYSSYSDLWVRFRGVRGSSFRSDMAIDLVQLFDSGPQTYLSSAASHEASGTSAGTTYQHILRVGVLMSSPNSPLNLTAMNFSTAGTTSLGDISNARLFYTGGSTSFSASNQFGSTIGTPGGSLSFTGSQSMAMGMNYFWLAVDVSPTATAMNVIDASCTNLTVGSTTATPTNASPAGAVTIYSPLSGVYTIDPNGSGSRNFTSFTAAVDVAQIATIGGPVTFEVASGTYNEQVLIPQLPGLSSINTVTFDGLNNNPVLSHNTSADLDYVIRIDRADYITLKNLTINNNGTEGLGIHLTSPSSNTPCEYITIDNCTINMSTTTTDTYTAAIGAFHPTSTGTNYNYVENLLVQNCTINGGGSAIYLRAYTSSSSSYRSTGNRILNNTIKDYYYYGIYFYYYHSDPQVIGNNLEQRLVGSNNNNGYGIYFYRTQEGGLIAKNRVVGRGYGIRTYYYINYYSMNTNRLKIWNNMITIVEPATSTTQDQWGIYAYYRVKYLDIYHNNINIVPRNDANNDQYGLYLDYYSSSYDVDWRVRNNMIQIDRSANGGTPGRPWAIWNDNDAMISQCDYNAYYSSSTGTTFRWDGSDRTWATLPKTTYNANSVWGPAYYVSPTDLHSRSHVGYLAASFIGVIDDYDGDIRNPMMPCIGADEYPTPPPENDVAVSKVLFDYAEDTWTRKEGAYNHKIKAVIENVGLSTPPATVQVGYATSPMTTSGDADELETLSPTWTGNTGVVEFAAPLTGLAPNPMQPVYVRTFWGPDSEGSNDQDMDTHEVWDDKVHGFEDFENFDLPFFSYADGYLDMPWTVVDNNGGDELMVAPGVGVGGSNAVQHIGTINAADEWLISPGAVLLPEASYRGGFVFTNNSSVPVTIEMAYGTSPSASSMTTFAVFSNIGPGTYTAADLWVLGGEAGFPYFNTPASGGTHYFGIHTTTAGPGYDYTFDNIKFDDNPSPPPKIGYAPPGSPIEDFVDNDSDPILVTATYKQPGLINKTFQVATTTKIYGFRGDMLWDVESSDSWIRITKETPDPTEQGYNLTPPRPRQFQTFTMSVNPAGLAPGLHIGYLTFYAILFNDDFPPPNQGLVATNEPLVVEVQLRITDAGSGKTGKATLVASMPGPFTVPGSPYFFVDNQTGDPVATLEVTSGQIDALTITAFPNQLPQNLARMLYVMRYWQIQHAGTGWTADITFPYADHEAAMILDRSQLRGVRQAVPMGAWEDPITGTTSISDPLHSTVTVQNFNEMNIMGNIALAHPYAIFTKGADAAPDNFALDQNYPNPFNPSTRIGYAVPEDAHVRLVVYNGLGMEVAVLVDETLPAGFYEADFDASGLATGTYLYRMTAGDFTLTRTMTLSK